MTAWVDYIDARRRMIHEWSANGASVDDICGRLALSVEKVESILVQLADPPLPGCSREVADKLRQRVAELERLVHRIRETPSSRPAPEVSDVRGLLSNPNPALCGCQYWSPSDGMTLCDRHHQSCVFASRTG
jgi:hypothetical protein